MECSFYSDVLGMCCSMNVIVPQQVKTQIGLSGIKSARKDYPVLYLLHGLTDDHTVWCRRTSIERYVADMGLVVVMPNVHRSFYHNISSGDYWTFISEELPEIVKGLFPVSRRREDTFAAGLSMGGYGALKLGLRCPEKFAAVASLSGSVDVLSLFSPEIRGKEFISQMTQIFGPGEELPSSISDLFAAVTELKNNPSLPKPGIFLCCGTDDHNYDANCRMREHLLNSGFDPIWKEAPGDHEWGFWDRHILESIRRITVQPTA